MEDVIGLIDRLIEEHKTIMRDTEALEAASDAVLIEELSDARESFVPGRLDQKQSLRNLQESVNRIDGGLQAHFSREETRLLAAAEELGDRKLVETLDTLLLEHTDLRNRVSQVKEDIAALIDGEMGRHHWEASAHDMRTHLTHTRRLLGVHASSETQLFLELRRQLAEETQ